MKFTQEQKKIRRRLMEVIHQARTSHIGSALSVIDIIDAIHQIKKKNDKFILSNGHAAAAYYVILEKHKFLKDIDLNKLGVHPDRNEKIGIDLSTGSLGQGLPIALGMALASPKKKVFCVMSDGESAEGSVWESIRVYQDQFPNNLRIIISANGWGAYDRISSKLLKNRFKGFGLKVINLNGHNTDQIVGALGSEPIEPTLYFAKTTSEQLPFLKGLVAHYHTMSDDEYQLSIKKFS